MVAALPALAAAAALLGSEPYGQCWSAASRKYSAPCGPGNEMCGPPVSGSAALAYHIHDLSCPAGDTDFPFHDPVHGVYHVMYQDAVGGKHPTHTVIGHAVSRDMLRWAHMPVSIWHDRPWDSFSVFTGSATLVGGKPFLIYPGNEPPPTSSNFAMAVPADPADPLYTNWTKDRRPGVDIAANPIVANATDDPSTAWRTKLGEWRFLSNGGQARQANGSFAPIFAATAFTGKWRYVGDSPLLAGECGSLFPLPPLYPGTAPSTAEGSPTHVHKRGCGPGTCASWGARGDHMTLGNWTDGTRTSDVGTWAPAGPEQIIDQGYLYAGKDFWDAPNKRRIFFGWATVPSNPQSLARVVSYHPQLQQLVFSPMPELAKLHKHPPLAALGTTPLSPKKLLALGKNNAAQTADFNCSFARPKSAATLGIHILGAATAYVEYVPGASVRVGIYDGAPQFPSPQPPPANGSHPVRADQLQLLPSDTEITLRVFTDRSILEVYWMDGRVAITSPLKPQASSVEAFSSVDGTLASATAWSMNSIWVTPQEVIVTPRQAMKSDDADDGAVLTRGQPMAMQWNQNLSISEAPPLRPGQAVSYSVAVWLTGCSQGQAAQEVVLTLSLMAHSGLATHMPECAAYESVSFVECAVPSLECGDVYMLRVSARLPTEGLFAPHIASVTSDSVGGGFRTFEGGFTPMGIPVGARSAALTASTRVVAPAVPARGGPYFACAFDAGKKIRMSGGLTVPLGHPCATCCFSEECWLDRGQLVTANFALDVGQSGADGVTIEGFVEGLDIDGTRGPPWPVKPLPKECTLNGSRLVCYKDRVVPGMQRGFSGLELPQPLNATVSAANAARLAIVGQFWAARTAAGDLSWAVCRTFVNPRNGTLERSVKSDDATVPPALGVAGPGGYTPGWSPTYDMSLSTVIQPCDNNELMSSGPNWPTIRSFGLIDVDWSNSKAEWINTKPMTCEENLVKQAELIKANNTLKGQKIWIYRNPVLAMPWMTSTAKIMNDPAYDVWFLHFKPGADGRSATHHDNDGTYHNRVCDDTYDPPKCSELFHSQIQTMEPKGGHAEGWDPVSGNWTKLAPPDGVCTAKSCDCGRVPCGFYLFDHRQGETKVKGQTLREWFVENMFITPTGLESPAVDGFFVDDMWPKPNPNRSWPPPPSRGRNGNPWGDSAGDLDGTEIQDCNLSFTDASDLYTGWVQNMRPMVHSILNHKKPGFIWQMMNGGSGIWADVAGYTGSGGLWRVTDKADCAAKLRDACRADSKQQTGAFNYVAPNNKTLAWSGQTLGFIDFAEHLAAFLLMRGPYAWFGYGWVGCSQNYTRPPELDTDYGTPQGLCHETTTGVFERSWSKAHVKLDCNSWQGTITHKTDDPTVHAESRSDLCAGAPTQCSPEICDLEPGQVQRLARGTYYHNKQIFLPKGSAIIGAGINVTYIVACGPPLASACNMTERRGFLMGDDTYVGNLSFTGRENSRSGCPLGGGMIETPGCQGDYCGLHKLPPKGAPLCNPPDRTMEQCVGIANATAEYIHLHSWTQDHVGWFPPTFPWGADGISGSRMITLRNLTSWGTYADGINFHGGHKYALVEDCEISFTGDDLYAHWPQATFRPGFEKKHDPRDCSDRLIFRNNIGRYPRFGTGPTTICEVPCRGPGNTNPCFSLWGSGANTAIIDNHCEEADGPVGMHKMYTNTKNIQMWCGPLVVDGNTYSSPGYCSPQHCQPNGDDRVCYSAGAWPTDGTLGSDPGCNQTALPTSFRRTLWQGLPSVAFPKKLKLDDEATASQPRGAAPVLMNNTRLNYPGPTPPTFVCDSAQKCLDSCVADNNCGGMVWMSPYEPLPVTRPGCAKQRHGIDGCCYPAPIFDHYQVIKPPQPATFGFVSAIVRTNASKPWPPPPPPPTPPPPWIPASWKPTWEMNRSITTYWRNSTGIEPAEFYDGMGMAIFDWAHAAEDWANPRDGGPSDNGGVLARQCAVIKKRQGPDFRCIVYRNSVIALNQFRHVSKVLDDPAYSGYFLKFKQGATQATKADGSPDCWGIADPRAKGCKDTSCSNCLGKRTTGCNDPIWPTPAVCATSKPSDVHVPLCDKADPSKCSKDLYFDQNQCAQVPGDNWSNDTDDVYQGLICKGKTCNCGEKPCGEYLFDFRNESLVEWFLHTHMGGSTALGHQDVDGLILDDVWGAGPSEIDSHSIQDMGLSAAEAQAVRAAYETTLHKLLAYIAVQGKSLPGGHPMAYGGDMMSTHSTASCKSKLEQMCGATPVQGQWYAVNYAYVPPPTYGVKAADAALDVAYFMLTRAPFAWIGGGPMLGWHMSHWWAPGKQRRINFRHDLRPAEFNLDVGEPTNNCSQTSPGVYTRSWTKVEVTVDCNAMKGKIVSSASAARRPVKVDDDIDGPEEATVGANAQQLRGAAETCAKGRADSAPGSHPLQLGCSAGGVITSVTFAQYGLISGTCPSLSTKGTKGCDADITKPVESACIGQSSCTVYCDHSCCPVRPGCCGCTTTSGSNKTEVFASVPDPFPGANKSLAVQVTCSNSLPETIAPPLPTNGRAENLNKIRYFSWYSYTGCQMPGCQRNMSASAGTAYRNLAMDGDLAYLSKTYEQFSVPGMLYLQNSIDGCNHTRVYDYSPAKNGLAPGWEVAVDDCIKTLIPLAKGNGGHIHGVQLGDELVLGSIPRFSVANLTALAARFHDALSPHDVFIFTNEGGGVEVPSWPEIPAGLDHISIDMYGSGACEAASAQVIYERIFALLKPHQSVWVVPGLFGAPNATAMAENDESLVEKLSAYFAWADTEPRITGVIPWHWYDLGGAPNPPYNGPPQLRLGADSFPKTLAWIADKVGQLAPLPPPPGRKAQFSCVLDAGRPTCMQSAPGFSGMPLGDCEAKCK